jgi:hypothetical protein
MMANNTVSLPTLRAAADAGCKRREAVAPTGFVPDHGTGETVTWPYHALSFDVPALSVSSASRKLAGAISIRLSCACETVSSSDYA